MKLKMQVGGFIAMIIISLLGFAGHYIYSKKSQRDYQNLVTTAIQKGQIVIDQEFHHWTVSVAASHEPLEFELFVRNKSDYIVSGHLIFTGDMNDKGLEEKWITTALDIWLRDGYQIEQFKGEEFAQMGEK